jgi:hypothetical protein
VTRVPSALAPPALRAGGRAGLAFLLLVPLGRGAAQGEAPGSAPAALLERVVVLGASVSCGFQAETDLARALAASLRRGGALPRSQADTLLFLGAPEHGPGQVERAAAQEPTLIVAVDFLFWFGYGSVNADGGLLVSEPERLALLERGLALLEPLHCPLVVADFPDVSAAVGRGMLQAAQLPAPETLRALSRRVREWARARPHTLVLPLSELVPALARHESVRIGRHLYPAEADLLQDDLLHPTLEGLVAIAQLVADELVRAGLAREQDFDFELESVLGRVERRAKLEALVPRR